MSIRNRLEVGTVACLTLNEATQVSVALSLKRIADSLERNEKRLDELATGILRGLAKTAPPQVATLMGVPVKDVPPEILAAYFADDMDPVFKWCSNYQRLKNEATVNTTGEQR